MIETGYVIRSTTERDDDTGGFLYWSNEDGWVTKEDATVFEPAELRSVSLPIGGRWEEL